VSIYTAEVDIKMFERPRPAAPVPPDRPQGLFSLLLTLNRNPLEALPRYHYEQPIVLGNTPLGRFAIVSDPDAIRSVLVDDPDSYRKDDLQNLLLRPALGNGLLTSAGHEWRVQRRCFAPAFAPRNISSYLAAMNAEAAALADRWKRLEVGHTLDVAEEMARTMLDILASTLFSGGLGRNPAEFRSAATRYFETQGRIDPLDLLGAPSWLPRIGALLSRPALKFFPRVVQAILSDRRRLIAENPSADADDFVNTLINARDVESGTALSDAEIASNIITFIGAGFETPANALSWALYLLSIDEAWRKNVENEADRLMPDGRWDGDKIDDFVVTRALLEETMRLYPPVAILSRKAIRDHSLRGREIRAGTTVIIAPWVLHRHQTLWEAPDRFDPSRFMPQRRGSINRFAYIPFGAGPRVCIGAAFAMQQMTITLATIARSFRLDLVPGHRILPVHRVTLRPEGGMMMSVSRRR
jgi:cytochrome P450